MVRSLSIRTLLAALALSCVLVPALAAAEREYPMPIERFGLGLSLGYQDVHAAIPYTGPGDPFFTGIQGGAIAKFGVDYRNRLGQSPWVAGVGFEYGMGGARIENDTDEFRESLKGIEVRAGLDYLYPANDKLTFYGGGRLFYSSTTLTYEDDDDEFEGEPFTVFGFEPAIGCYHRMGPSWSLYGEMYSQFGLGSTEVGDTRYSETVKYGCWRGGVLFGF